MARRSNRRRKRVFVSFDFDNDRFLKEALIGQARLADSPFEVINHSLKEAAPQRLWEVRARNAIQRSDLVLVMLGKRTRFASGVLKEVRMARSLGKPVVQVLHANGYRSWAIPGAGRVVPWTWTNLKKLLG